MEGKTETLVARGENHQSCELEVGSPPKKKAMTKRSTKASNIRTIIKNYRRMETAYSSAERKAQKSHQ